MKLTLSTAVLCGAALMISPALAAHSGMGAMGNISHAEATTRASMTTQATVNDDSVESGNMAGTSANGHRHHSGNYRPGAGAGVGDGTDSATHVGNDAGRHTNAL